MVYKYTLHQISNFEVKIIVISEFEFVTVIAIVDLVVKGEGAKISKKLLRGLCMPPISNWLIT